MSCFLLLKFNFKKNRNNFTCRIKIKPKYFLQIKFNLNKKVARPRGWWSCLGLSPNFRIQCRRANALLRRAHRQSSYLPLSIPKGLTRNNHRPHRRPEYPREQEPNPIEVAQDHTPPIPQPLWWDSVRVPWESNQRGRQWRWRLLKNI